MLVLSIFLFKNKALDISWEFIVNRLCYAVNPSCRAVACEGASEGFVNTSAFLTSLASSASDTNLRNCIFYILYWLKSLRSVFL